MQDRVPVNPGRVLVTPENCGAAYYATLTRADNPTQEGTPLNKANLLKDATAALFGLGADAVPDDVLNAIKTLINGANAHADTKAKIATGSYTGTGTEGASGACSLNVGFRPKAVFISANDAHGSGALFFFDGQTEAYGFAADSVFATNITFTSTGVSWYANTADYQLNTSGVKYCYCIFG